MTKLLDGKKLAKQLKQEMKAEIETFSGRPPGLSVVLVGHHPASKLYVQKKKKACEEIGIASEVIHLDEMTTKQELHATLQKLNQNPRVDGILVQLPLPQHLNPLEVAEWVHPDKDVDGLHPINMGKLLLGSLDGFIPCTPLGIKKLLDHYQISVTEKHVVVLGRSNIVGKPMGALLTQINPGYDATVTILHRNSPDLIPICLSADILIVAAGHPHLIQPSFVKPKAVIVDVGINQLEDLSKKKKKVVGDVDFDKVKEICSYISPVPGGVGPMTIAMLLENTLRSYKRKRTHETPRSSS